MCYNFYRWDKEAWLPYLRDESTPSWLDSVFILSSILKEIRYRMARTILDSELQELDAQIITVGRMVDEALGKSLESQETGDQAKAGMVNKAHAQIDSLRAATEEHTIRVL